MNLRDHKQKLAAFMLSIIILTSAVVIFYLYLSRNLKVPHYLPPPQNEEGRIPIKPQ